MADVSWLKLKTEMFSDDKIKLIESMPEADSILIIWIKLLCQAAKTNANGYIFLNQNVPFTTQMLTTLFNRPFTIIELALKTLRDFGMISINESGMILIENWTKHQNAEGLDKIREQTSARVRKYREKQKLFPPFKEKIKNIDKEECVTGNVTETLQNKKLVRIKTLDQVKTYFSNKNYPVEEAVAFFNHYEAQDWVTGSGVPIYNWQSKAENWHLEQLKRNSDTHNIHEQTKTKEIKHSPLMRELIEKTRESAINGQA